MARFLFISWDGGGNQPPTFAIARALRARGHHVRVAGYPSQREAVGRAGLDFACLASAEHPQEFENPILARVDGVFANPGHLKDVPAQAAAFEPDVTIVDCMLFAGLAGAELARLTAMTLVHSGPRVLGNGTRPPILAERLAAVRGAAGLAPGVTADESWRRFPALATSFPELDGPAVPGYHYVGPVFDDPESGWVSPWPAEDPRPLVIAALSTFRGFAADNLERYQVIIDGCADLPVRVLVTGGGAVEANRLRLPANALVVGFVPHLTALAGAALCITHAGHGTVCASLRAGVPLVCLPGPFADQANLADRLREVGAGTRLDPSADPASIGAAVMNILEHSSYRDAAIRLADAIRSTPGEDGAVTYLETLACAER